MIIVPTGARVHVALGMTDMRNGMCGLSMMVQKVLAKDPFSGHLFVFRGRRADQASFSIPFAICCCRIPVASVARRATASVPANGTPRPANPLS